MNAHSHAGQLGTTAMSEVAKNVRERASRLTRVVLVASELLALLTGRGFPLSLENWRDVEQQPGVVLVQAPEMSAAQTAVVPEERVRAFPHQMEGPALPARRTMLDRRHDVAAMILARELAGYR